MPTHKKFFMYLIWVILFFVFSRVMIFFALSTTYSYKDVTCKSSLIKEAAVETNAVTGTAKIDIYNNTNKDIKEKYIKIECYSKHDVVMGTKYIKIDNIQTNEEKEFEVIFNYNNVDKAIIDVIDELPDNTTEEQKISDTQLTFVALVAAVITLMVI